MARATGKTRQSKDPSAAVPVLDKGDYNDKKTLSYFLEQEKIAKKMIAEANAFYDSFLSSKIVTLHTVLTRYPLTPIVRPMYKLYYGAADVKKLEYGESLTYLPDGDDSDIVIAPVFGFNVGSEAEGYFEQELYGQWGFLRDFENCADAVKSNDKQYLKYSRFKKPADVALLYDRYCALDDRIRQATTDSYAVVKVKDLKDYISEHDMTYIGYSGRSSYDGGGLIGFDSAHCLDKDKYHEVSNKWRSRLDIHPIPFKIKKCPEEIVKQVKQYQTEFSAEMRNILLDLIPLCKDGIPNFMLANFMFTHEGGLVEVIEKEIESTKFDKKTGRYTIQCKSGVESHPEYNWPSDAPLIETSFCQTFVFDIATNDLIDYSIDRDTRKIDRRHRY
jgi:hypothetical protein